MRLCAPLLLTIVKGKVHWTIKEMILFGAIALERTFINEEIIKEKEEGLGFIEAR